MTTPTKTIPVPVDVLRRLVSECMYGGEDDEGLTIEQCGMCAWVKNYNVSHSEHCPDCPIPALREAVEESEKR